MKIGVTSWSWHQPTVIDALNRARESGFEYFQLGLCGIGVANEAEARDLRRWLRGKKLKVISTCAGFPGEDYSTLETIHRTGGYGWDEKFEERFKQTLVAAAVTKIFGVRLLTVHAGFIPEDTKSKEFAVFVKRLRKVADALKKRGLVLGLESGQETAKTLHAFLKALKRRNVKVNFDPANMILYGKQEPLEALQLLQSSVAQMHMKDALWTKTPGTWGTEVPLGNGAAHIREILAALKRRRFRGALIIEREGGDDRIGDIRKAKKLIERCLR